MTNLLIGDTSIIVEDTKIEFTFLVDKEKHEHYKKNAPTPDDFGPQVRTMTNYLVNEGFIEGGRVEVRISVDLKK